MTGREGRRRRWAWLAGWAILTVLLVLALRGIAWNDAVAALLRADPAWLAAAVVANFLILPVAAWQWMFLLPADRDVGFRNMFWIRSVTSTVANGGPFLAGYAATVHLLAVRGGVGYEAGTSMKALEQVAEGIAKLSLVAATVLVVWLPAYFRATALVLVLVVPLLAIGLYVGARRAGALQRWAEGRSGRVGSVLRFVARVADGLEVIRSPKAFGSGVALALLQKVAEGLALWAVVASLGVPVPAWGLLLVLTAVNLSTMMSVTPANLGIYEGSAFVAYRVAGVGSETALGLALLHHVTYLVPMAGVGWTLLAAEGLGFRRLTARAERAEPERADAGLEPANADVEREGASGAAGAATAAEEARPTGGRAQP